MNPSVIVNRSNRLSAAQNVYRQNQSGLIKQNSNHGDIGDEPRDVTFIDKLASGMKISEFSRKTRISPKTVYDWIYRDRLPQNCFIRVNGRIRLIPDEMEIWLSSQQGALF